MNPNSGSLGSPFALLLPILGGKGHNSSHILKFRWEDSGIGAQELRVNAFIMLHQISPQNQVILGWFCF